MQLLFSCAALQHPNDAGGCPHQLPFLTQHAAGATSVLALTNRPCCHHGLLFRHRCSYTLLGCLVATTHGDMLRRHATWLSMFLRFTTSPPWPEATATGEVQSLRALATLMTNCRHAPQPTCALQRENLVAAASGDKLRLFFQLPRPAVRWPAAAAIYSSYPALVASLHALLLSQLHQASTGVTCGVCSALCQGCQLHPLARATPQLLSASLCWGMHCWDSARMC